MSIESIVKDRYTKGANTVVKALCCPVDYDQKLLKVLPQEIIDRDYGCGDPSRYVQETDVVLDLGSGGGKICYMAAQLVGEHGKVIGIDMTDDMLALARKYQTEIAAKIGSDRVEFHKGYIQDLALDIGAMVEYLADHPVTDIDSLDRLEQWQENQKAASPLIADNTIDLVISNCVLNLVDGKHKKQLIDEIYRVLKPGGRFAISDIVSDETIPDRLKADAELWSGCISGAFQEEEFIKRFKASGFVSIRYDKWDNEPWQVVEGIEFRSVTLVGVKPDARECLDYGHAVIYRGPYDTVTDDEGHIYYRGKRMAVCERTFDLVVNGVYANDFIGIKPADPVAEPRPWCAPAGTLRPLEETKKGSHTQADTGDCC